MSAWPKSRPAPIPDSTLDAEALKAAGISYAADVKPLLKRACFDCHSSQTDFPWYHHVPGIAWYLDNHVREAREHLDLSDDFPFKSRGTIASRVRGIGGSLKRGSMPLWDYKLMHPAARLSQEEIKKITDWSDATYQKLSETAKLSP
jgi:hypothetical protein